MTPDLILTDLGNTGIVGLQESLDRKGLNASGKLRSSFKVEVSESVIGWKMQIITEEGKLYWQFLNDANRPAGGRPPIGAIIQWSIDKAIPFDTDNQRRSFAFAVATNIAKGLYMKTFDTERRKNFAADVFESDAWKVKETQAIANIAAANTERIVGTFFKRPQPA